MNIVHTCFLSVDMNCCSESNGNWMIGLSVLMWPENDRKFEKILENLVSLSYFLFMLNGKYQNELFRPLFTHLIFGFEIFDYFMNSSLFLLIIEATSVRTHNSNMFFSTSLGWFGVSKWEYSSDCFISRFCRYSYFRNDKTSNDYSNLGFFSSLRL